MDTNAIETTVMGECERVISNFRKSLAETGRGYPPEFVSTTADSLFELVDKAIKARGLPKDVISALELARILKTNAEDLKDGSIVDVLAEDLINCIPEALQLIKALGGAFYTTDENCISFDPAQANQVESVNQTA